MSQKDELHIKYRPSTMDEMVGQQDLVCAVQGMIDDNSIPHVMLFTGTSGTGKTTSALIIADSLGITEEGVQMIDCATNSGADAMRDIIRGAALRPLGAGARKMIILDECHALSRQAQQALLIATENCPDHLFLVLCTTDSHKVIKPLMTRCQEFRANQVKYDDLVDLLEYVAKEEGIDMPEKDLGTIARESEGSPRQALVNLAKCRYAEGDEIKSLLNTAADTLEGIELCRLLIKGHSASGFASAIKIINKMPEVAPETIRLMVTNYFNKVLLGGAQNVHWCLEVLEAFSCGTAFNPSEKMAPVLLALGDIYLD